VPGILPQYNGHCAQCTAVAYYCPDSQLCYSDLLNCHYECGLCYEAPSQCPGHSNNGTLPPYNGNCSACTGASGAYCAGDNKCWKTDFDCNTDCGFEVCMTTQKQCAALPPATATPGILPNYNCVQCTNVGGGYCTDSGRCYSDMLHCQYHCVRCDSVPSQCSSNRKVGRRL